MCGIAGAFSLASPAGNETLSAMAHAIAHRGPDGEGIRTFPLHDAWCALIHRRLAILDLSSAGYQPMASADESAWIVFNGEIYNYLELREELRTHGHEFRTGTDTEVLLAAWKTWGRAMLPRLNGMFAMAICEPASRRLFIARDRFGEKPLFYRSTSNSFAFASEMKAFRPLDGTLFPALRVDEQWLAEFLAGEETEHRARTYFDGVFRLPQGHSLDLTCERGTIAMRIERWYSLPTAASAVSSSHRPAERFRELFDDSVRLRLRSDVPVGTSLSGGLDSSAVVTSISSLSEGNAAQHSFTYRSADEHLDETKFARTIAASARVLLHEVSLDPAAVERDFDRLAYSQEEPFRTLSPMAQFQVFARARAEGIVVLLDGQGADEILGGYLPHVASMAGDRLMQGKFGAMRATLDCAPSNLRSRLRRELLISVLGPRLPSSLRRGLKRPRGAVSLLSRGARLRLTTLPLPEPVHPRSSLDASLRHYAYQGPLQGLLRYADRNSMAHGREVRLPFLDHRLVELAFSLPDEEKIGGGFTKRVLRDSMVGRIPDDVRLRRDKIGFEAPDASWLSGPLGAWLAARMELVLDRFSDVIDAAAARRALEIAKPGAPRRAEAIAMLLPWVAAEACARTMLTGPPGVSE